MRSLSLRQKLLIPLAVVGAMLGGFLYAIWNPQALLRAEAARITLVERHLDSVVEGLIPLLLGRQLDNIHESLAALAKKNGEWVDIRLLNAEGKQLYPLLSSAPAPARDGGQYRTLQRDIAFLETSLGRLVVTVDMDPVLRESRQEHALFVLVLASMLVILVVTLATVAELAVIRPSRRLAHAAMELAKQNFDVPLPELGSDDIGRLVASFGQMRESLRQYRADLLGDIEQRKRIEADLRRYQQDLEEMVQARTVELLHAKDAAEAANAAKSVFLSNMSHELRTPLNAILGFAQLMERDATTPAHQRRNLETINRSGRNLLALINDILEISKIEAGRMVVSAQACDLPELVASLVESMELRAAGKGLALHLDIGAEVPRFINIDVSKLRQLLLNLLSNAVKYTAHGEVAVAVAAKSGDHATTVEFTVRDTGMGIEPGDLERIFQPFYQTASGIKTGEGTGLGLAIARQYAELLGGRLGVTSAVGTGTSFTFTLPVEVVGGDASGATATRHAVALASGQAACRVLVVEDNVDNQELVRQLLEGAGFLVQVAGNGEAAIASFSSWRPNLVLMDMRMPVMDGYEATRRIRMLEGGKAVPVIALTASAFEEDKARILEAGCDDMARKPVDADQLFAILGRYLDVQFVYSDEADGGARVPRVPDLSSLSPETRARLAEAATLLDGEAIRTLADTLRGSDPAVATWLREVADRYEFEAIRAQLVR